MPANSIFIWESQEFSKTFPSLLSIVWELRDFSKMEVERGDGVPSQKFQFLNCTWLLEIFPCGVADSGTGEVLLYLVMLSPTVPDLKVKCKFFYRDKFRKEFHPSQYVQHFIKGSNFIPNFRIKKEDLLNGEMRDLLLAEDTLTVCCEMREADPEDVPTGSEGITDWLNSEQEVISEAVATVYEETLFPDVTLKVDGEDFPAHKAILSSRSSVFRGMFQADMKENRERVADIHEMEAQTARQMLRYIYTGKVCDLEDESATSLYVAADRYDLQGLKVRCLQYLLRNMSVDNVCQLAVLAHLYTDEKLNSAVRLFISKNHQSVLQSATWKMSAAEKPVFFMELISSVLMNVELVPKNESENE